MYVFTPKTDQMETEDINRQHDEVHMRTLSERMSD